MLLGNTCNKLLMQPVEQVPSVHSVDFPACLPEGQMLSRTSLQMGTLFVHKQVRRQCQRPEPLDSSGAHQLVLIQSQQLLAPAAQQSANSTSMSLTCPIVPLCTPAIGPHLPPSHSI